MMNGNAPIWSAFIALFGAVCLAYLNGFVVERYKRFMEGSAIAAGLVGELGSYAEALPLLIRAAEALSKATVASQLTISLRPIDRPQDRFYEASVGRLGLLGPQLVEDVVYVYGNITGFRVGFEILSKSHESMDHVELAARGQAILGALTRAKERGEKVLPDLRKRASAKFAWRNMF